jgi:DNA-directed RNA polymerase subunit RPC12/RpoP
MKKGTKRRRDQDFDQLPPPPTSPPEVSSDPEVHAKIVTEVMHCHSCSKKFSARVDYRINGNHVVLCAYCSHEHCRVIENGRVTSDRWSDRNDTVRVQGECRWSDQSLRMETSTVFDHVRRAWLERVV